MAAQAQAAQAQAGAAQMDWGDLPVQTKLQINQAVDAVAPLAQQALQVGAHASIDLAASASAQSVTVVATQYCGPSVGPSLGAAAGAASLAVKPQLKNAATASVGGSVQFTATKSKEMAASSVDYFLS